MSEPIRASVAVDALLDELAIAHLDFHPLCQTRVAVGVHVFGRPVALPLISSPCLGEAVGAITCRMCGTGTTVCAEHGMQAIAPTPTACGACGTYSTDGSTLFRFTPDGA